MRGNAYFLIPLMMLASCYQEARISAEKPIALTHISVLNMADGSVANNKTVVIKGTQISAILDSDITELPNGTLEIPAHGKYLLPGLWDMHVHTADVRFLANYIANGITGVRDMGGSGVTPDDGCASRNLATLEKWRKEINSGKRIGPHMILAGPAVSGTGAPGSLSAQTVEQANAAVVWLKKSGADFVKVYEGIPLEAYDAMAVSAYREKMRFAGHVPELTVPLLHAINSGQRSIEHVRAPLMLCALDSAAEAEKFMAEDKWSESDRQWGLGQFMQCSSVITALKNSDTWLTPTLTVEHAKIAAQQISFRTHQERQNMPSEIRAAFARYLAANDAKSPEERNSDLAWWRLQIRLVQRMNTEGVAILAGTDSACQGGIPGTDLHTELALMVEAGLTPLQALRTATVEPARYFNRPFATDLIRPGNEADLTVLNFNPLADIHNTRSVHGVVFQGKWLSRDMLDKLYQAIN